MSIANVQFRLDSGDTQTRLARFALDSAQVRDSWRALPADVKQANENMLRLAQTQVRVGHMQSRDRDLFHLHQERIARHHEQLSRKLEGMRNHSDAHPLMGQYQGLKAGGTRAAWRQAMADPAFADLHEHMRGMGAVGGQIAGMNATGALVSSTGADGRFHPGQAANYWGRKAMWGSHGNGDPKTAGEFAKDTATAGFQWVRQKANQVTGLFTVFDGIRLVTKSMAVYQDSAETVQALGAQMGGGFQGVAAKLKDLRSEYKLTLSDIKGGMGHYTAMTGSVLGSEDAVRYARATGLDPNAVLGAYGKMRLYGPTSRGIMEAGLDASGMGNKPQAYLDWMASITQGLGHGMYQVPTGEAAKYLMLVSQSMGGAYQNERGKDLTMRLLSGMGGGGADPAGAARLHAVRGLGGGRLNIGTKANPEILNTNTYRGMMAALESKHPAVLEALYRESSRLGGGGEMGEAIFQSLAGGGLNIFESDRIFKGLRKGGGKMPHEIESGTLDERLAGVRGTDAYVHQRIASEMETDVYEPIGEKLRPIALDFQEAGKLLGQRLANATDAISAANELLSGIGAAANYMRNSANPASRAIFEFSLLGGSLAQILLKQGVVAAGQAGAAATGGVSTGKP